MAYLLNFIRLLCDVLTLAIFLRALISWFSPMPSNRLVSILHQVTEPVLAPLRRILPRTGMIDLAPLAAILLLQLITYLLP